MLAECLPAPLDGHRWFALPDGLASAAPEVSVPAASIAERRVLRGNSRFKDGASLASKAGGLTRTSTRPILNLLPPPPRLCMSVHPDDNSCPDIGRVLVLSDPPAPKASLSPAARLYESST